MAYLGSRPARTAVTSDQITDGVVTAAKLATDSVTTVKIAADNVTTAKIAAANVTTAKLAASSALVGKNIIHNGAHLVDQRSGDTRTGFGAAAVFLDDRWKLNVEGSASARWTASVEADGGVNGSSNWLKMLCTTADASPGAAEQHHVRQVVEAQNCQPIVSASGKIAAFAIGVDLALHVDGASSISFPAKVALGVLTYDGTGRQYVEDVLIPAADTWYRRTVLVPADETGSFPVDNGSSLALTVALYGGSNVRVATESTWENNATDTVTANSDNVADATNNYLGLTNVQLEVGSVATDFEHEDYGTTLKKCQRYLWRLLGDTTAYAVAGVYNSAATTAEGGMRWPNAMRAAPTITVSAAGDFAVRDTTDQRTVTNFGTTLSSIYSVRLEITCSGGGLNDGNGSQLVFIDNSGNFFQASAEL
jgi:hypothetical protein